MFYVVSHKSSDVTHGEALIDNAMIIGHVLQFIVNVAAQNALRTDQSTKS